MNFSIEKKGYSVVEVDAYVEDLESKYARLQAQNAELEQKLATAKRLIRRFSDTENALKQNIADSKRAAAYMISDARDRSSELLDSARESCGEIISDLDMQISERMSTVSLMKAEVASFRDELFALYSAHIEMIDTLAGTAESFEYEPDYTPVAEAVDKFEEAGEPDCAVPEFVEYPEESIFAELDPEDETEAGEGGFVISEEPCEADEDIVFETEEASEEEDFSQLILETEDPADTADAEDIGFDLEGDEEIPDETADVEEDVFEGFDAEEPAEGEEPADGEEVSEEPDYFKFLSDFANSEDAAE